MHRVQKGRVKAFVHIESWAGRSVHEVVVIGKTRTRFRVRIVQPWRTRQSGEIVLVPLAAVRTENGGPIDWLPDS